MIKIVENILNRFRRMKIVEKVLPVKEKTITEIFQEGKCPDCGVWAFLEGPSGGMSTNIKCENCGSFFNDSGPFGLDRIRYIEHLILEFNNSVQFTGEVLTWEMIILENGKLWNEIYNWCHDNTKDNWCVKSGVPKSEGSMDERQTFYFKNPDDAVKFKLVWR